MLDKTILQDLYIKQRKTQKETAGSCGVARATIQDWMKKYNIPSRRQGPPILPINEQHKEYLNTLYVKEVRTCRDITKVLGVSENTVLNWLKKYDIPRRPAASVGQPIEKQIKTKINIDKNGCWNWVGGISNQGYGRLWSRGKRYSAHRISYELFVGKIPKDFTIDHKCRNRRCVNPVHLEAVTMKENILRGESPAAKNARKSYCKRGHLLSGDNLRIIIVRQRICKKCTALLNKQWKEKRRHESANL